MTARRQRPRQVCDTALGYVLGHLRGAGGEDLHLCRVGPLRRDNPNSPRRVGDGDGGESIRTASRRSHAHSQEVGNAGVAANSREFFAIDASALRLVCDDLKHSRRDVRVHATKARVFKNLERLQGLAGLLRELLDRLPLVLRHRPLGTPVLLGEVTEVHAPEPVPGGGRQLVLVVGNLADVVVTASSLDVPVLVPFLPLALATPLRGCHGLSAALPAKLRRALVCQLASLLHPVGLVAGAAAIGRPCARPALLPATIAVLATRSDDGEQTCGKHHHNLSSGVRLTSSCRWWCPRGSRIAS